MRGFLIFILSGLIISMMFVFIDTSSFKTSKEKKEGGSSETKMGILGPILNFFK